jgi:hypothetical protein
LNPALVDSVMKTWIGHTKQELLLSWALPTSVFSDGQNGEMWSYRSYREQNGYRYAVIRQFYINSDGVIYAYSWQGV